MGFYLNKIIVIVLIGVVKFTEIHIYKRKIV